MSDSFLQALSKSFVAYQGSGARSNKKLMPIHGYIANEIKARLDKNFGTHIYKVKALGIGDGKESKVEGKYYNKTLDIAILKDNQIITTVSIKFVTSSYKQNSNNYFENLLGETANITRSGIGFTHLLILRKETPYYSKTGELMKIQTLNKQDLQKYFKLFDDANYPHNPDVQGIIIVDIDEESKEVKFADLEDFDLEEKYNSIFSLEDFLNKVIALVTLKS